MEDIDAVSRIPFKQGKLALSYPTLPDLGCLLSELEEGTCRGTAMLQYLEPEMAAAWKKILVPQRPLHIRIDAPPRMSNFQINGIVTGVTQKTEGTVEIDVTFNQLTSSQKIKLKTAIMAEQVSGTSNPAAARTEPRPPSVRVAGPFHRDQKLGAVLVQMGYLTAPQADEAVRQAQTRGEKLGRYLARSGLVTTLVICRALALQSGLPMTDLNDAEISETAAKIFPLEVLSRYTFVPFDESKKMVCVAVADPLKPQVIADLERISGRKVEVFLAQEDLILKELDKIKGKQKPIARKYIRYDLSVQVSYQFCGRMGTPIEGFMHSGMTRDVCEDGFLIDGPPATAGTPDELRRRGICLNLSVAGASSEIKALCQLRSIKEIDNGKRWLMGLKVVEMTTEDRRKLKELCVQAIKKLRGQ